MGIFRFGLVLIVFAPLIGAQPLRLATGQAGGVYHELGAGWAELEGEAVGGIDITPVMTAGSGESMRMLGENGCSLAIVQDGTAADGEVRLLAPMHEEIVHVLVNSGSEVRNLENLRGKRIAIGPADSGTRQLVVPLFRHFGLGEGKYTPKFVGAKEACRLLTVGEIDAAIVVTGLGAPVIRDAVSRGGLRFMSLGDDPGPGGVMAGFQAAYPFVRPVLIPRHAYPAENEGTWAAPQKPIVSAAVRSLLVCRADLPERVAERVVRSLFTDRGQLVQTHPAAAQIREPRPDESFGFPVHPGAEAYYRRGAPSFIERYAEVLALCISLLIGLFGGLTALRRWIERRKKDRIDVFYGDLDSVLERLRQGELTRSELTDAVDEVRRLRHAAFQMLIAERLEADESFRIFQVMTSDCLYEIRERLAND